MPFLPVVCRALLLTSLVVPCLLHAENWLAPTPAELSMTSEPAAPNASAIYLYREEVSDDKLHMHSMYVRLKVLTEDGKKYADVEIPYEQRRFSITDVAGRTIHADGTIVPFTGRPYDKMIARTATEHYQKKIFSMPDVQVGSILEYRYKLRYDDNWAVPPTWYIQTELYLRKAHYHFVPTEHELTSGRDQAVNALMWTPILPKGDTVKKERDSYSVDVENVPPEPREEYLPPIHSLTYRVYFIYTPYNNKQEFWDKEGKYWSRQTDKFMDAHDALSAMVGQLTRPGDTPDDKLKKLYDGVMAFENTDYTRDRSSQEDKAEGLRTIKSVQDVIARKRGNSDQLTLLFVALARTAGLKAYVMTVTSRDNEIFNDNVLSMNQLDDDIAIVNVGGKDEFFDPGERYCAYGQLHWKHTMAMGLRQTDSGVAIDGTPDNHYYDSKTIRVATLTMADDGQVSGTVRVGMNGSSALSWRQRALKADKVEVEHAMEQEMQSLLPGGMTVKLDEILNVEDFSKQLIANFKIEGPLATPSSKRLFVPSEIFEVNARPRFSQAKRETPVYFDYAYHDTDQITITYPASISIESAPKPDQLMMQKLAFLKEGATVKGQTVTLVRDFALGSVIFKTDEYDDLRSFYAKVIRKDQEQTVLKVGANEPAAKGAGN